MKARHYSIHDLETITGIKAHTIRIWEQRYKLLNPVRTETNLRRYSNDDLRHLLNVGLLNNMGYRISRIASMSADDIRQLILKHEATDTAEKHVLEMLKLAMLNYDEGLFHQLVSRYEEEHNFEKLFLEVFMPFMHQVGVLWQSNTICPAQEHFISNLIRQKLFSRIDALQVERKEHSATYILYLPDPEIHELSLLMLHYLLKRSGYRSMYLGLSVPFTDLQDVYQRLGDVHFVSVFTSAISPLLIKDYFKRITAHFGHSDCHFHFTGKPLIDAREEGPLNVHIYPQMEDLTKALITN